MIVARVACQRSTLDHTVGLRKIPKPLFVRSLLGGHRGISKPFSLFEEEERALRAALEPIFVTTETANETSQAPDAAVEALQTPGRPGAPGRSGGITFDNETEPGECNW